MRASTAIKTPRNDFHHWEFTVRPPGSVPHCPQPPCRAGRPSKTSQLKPRTPGGAFFTSALRKSVIPRKPLMLLPDRNACCRVFILGDTVKASTSTIGQQLRKPKITLLTGFSSRPEEVGCLRFQPIGGHSHFEFPSPSRNKMGDGQFLNLKQIRSMMLSRALRRQYWAERGHHCGSSKNGEPGRVGSKSWVIAGGGVPRVC